jgi:hypothetical protein
MPNRKTSKLLSRYASATGRNYNEMKKWYDGLSMPQRSEATQLMREAIEPKQEAKKS